MRRPSSNTSTEKTSSSDLSEADYLDSEWDASATVTHSAPSRMGLSSSSSTVSSVNEFLAALSHPISPHDVDRLYWAHLDAWNFKKSKDANKHIRGSVLLSHFESFMPAEKAFCALQAFVGLQYLVQKQSGLSGSSMSIRKLSSRRKTSLQGSTQGSVSAFSVNAKYRLRRMERRFRYCLNGFCGLTSGGEAKESVAAVGEMLRDRMQSVQSAFISENGVDYAAMKASPIYAEFRRASAELHNIEDLGAMTEQEAMAFYLNLYNCMVLHAEVEVGHPGGMLERRRFYGRCCYQIGNSMFSLNDIEHGILRCNRTPPGAFFPMFSAKDVRRRLSFKTLDPRLHFALNCGAKSCPPIRVYSAKNVERVLQLAAEGFCSFNVVVDPQANTVCLSKIFQWYKGDFVSAGSQDKSHRELLEYICRYLPQDHLLQSHKGTVKVLFAPYNWSQNEDMKVAESVVQEAIQLHYGDSTDKEVSINMDWLSKSVTIGIAEEYPCARVLVMSDRFIVLHRDSGLSKSLLYNRISSVHHSSVARDDLTFVAEDGTTWSLVGNSGQDVQRLLDCLNECVGGGEDVLKGIFLENFVSHSNNLALEDVVRSMRKEKDDRIVDALTDLFHFSDRDSSLMETIIKIDIENVPNVHMLFREDNVLSTFFSKIAREAVPFLEKTVFHVLEAADAAIPDSTVVLLSVLSLSSTPPNKLSSLKDGMNCPQRCKLLVKLMNDNVHLLPKSLCTVWKTASRLASQKFPGSSMHVTATLVLLRWLCPSLVVPRAWGHQGLNLREPTRQLALQMSKCIQWLARPEAPSDETAAQVVSECSEGFHAFCNTVLKDDGSKVQEELNREELKVREKELGQAVSILMETVCKTTALNDLGSSTLVDSLLSYRFLNATRSVGLRISKKKKKSSASNSTSSTTTPVASAGSSPVLAFLPTDSPSARLAGK